MSPHTARPHRKPARHGRSSAASGSARATRRLAAWRRWLRFPRISALLRRLLAVVLGTVAIAWSAGPVYAQIAPGTLPSGGSVVSGAGSIATQGQTLTVLQSSPRLGIDWQSFSIGRDALVEFLQPGPASIALNRVVGHEATQIYGRLRANGQVFLTNPNGVLFAPGAKVDVGGLVASTLDMTQADFASGRDRFVARDGATGAVRNDGEIAARAGGYIALFGPQVDNRGELRVDAGSVVLASGRAATVSISGGGLISAVVDPGVAGSVLNSGRIAADGGSVTLSAASADALASSLVNNSGIVRANALEERNGEIWITGDRVVHSGVLQADAQGTGDAGRISVKGDMARGTLELDGRISARAGAGAGGQVETSAARVSIAPETRVDTRSAGGRHGTWLIDPSNFTVAAGDAVLSSSGIGASTLATNLGLGNVSLQTAPDGSEAGDLFVNAAVSWSADTVLTLTATRHVEINADITATGDAAGLAVNPGTAGAFTMATGTRVRLPGANSTFSIGGTAYTLVRSLADLRAIDGSATVLAGNYALADNLDAGETATVAFSPIGNEALISVTSANAFTGRFQGLGNAIQGLTIDAPSSSSAGLFANLGGARVENLRLVGGSVLGSQNVGAIAGTFNAATLIENVHADLAVSGVDDASTGVAVGGLLGNNIDNGGTIRRSSTSGNVSGDTPAAIAWVGGIVGRMSRGTLEDVSTTGAVSATLREGFTNDSQFYLGGVVGFSSSTITRATASGDVSGGHESGGLVGRYTPVSASIADSTASGDVSSTGPAGGLVGSASVGGGTGNTIRNSSATGNVSSTGAPNTDSHAGGAVGVYFLETPIGLSASGNVSGSRTAGGVIGFLQSTSVSLAAGSLISVVPTGTTKTVGAAYWAGGLVGYSNATGATDGLSFTGNVGTTGSISEGAAGGLIGRAAGPITNATSAGSVSGVLHAGGIVGYIAGTGGVSGATSSAAVSGTGNSSGVGGIAGWINSGSLTGSSFTGSVGGGGHVGALAGRLSNGSISGNTTTVTSVSGAFYVGGLVGYIAGATLSDLTSAIDVTHTGTSGGAGSLAGYIGGSIGGSTASGDVTATGSGDLRLGGLAGEVAGSVATSSASGTVSLPSTVVNGSVGGLVGLLTGTGGLSGGSATGAVSGGDAAGGLVGRFTATGGASIGGSSATGDVSGAGSVGGLVGVASGTGGIGSSSATGTVATTGAATAAAYAGGAVGHYNLSVGPTALSAAGDVSGGNATGGVIGWLQSGSVNLPEGSVVSVVPDGATRSVTGPRWVGGLVGYSSSTGTATGLGFAGQVTATSGSSTTGAAGGLFGRSNGAVVGSSSSGSVSGANIAGGLVGYAEGSGGFDDVHSTASVTGTTSGGYIGGLVGYFAHGGSLTNATASGAVSGGEVGGGLVGLAASNVVGAGIRDSSANGHVSGSAQAGGLVGQYAMRGSMERVTASGTVSGGSYAGGLVGYYNSTGTLDTASQSGATVTGTRYVGGLVGYGGAAAFNNVSAVADVSAAVAGAEIGGLVGRSGGSISNATATGDVSASGTTGSALAGGLVGRAEGSSAANFTDVTASGSVSVLSPASSTYAGGLIGYAQAGHITRGQASGATSGGLFTGGLVGVYSTPAGLLSDSSASGDVSGLRDVGGLVGYATGGGAISSSSASGNVSSAATTDYSAGGAIGYTSLTGGVSGVSASGTVSGAFHTGGVVGYNQGAPLSGLSTTITSLSGSGWVGGLVGYSNSSSVSGLSSAVAVTHTGTSGGAGGVIGYLNGSLTGSSATGSVTATGTTGTVLVGGLAGEVDTGAITTASASGNVSGGSETGGLVGRYNPTGGQQLSGGTASGQVSGRGSVGGLVGVASGTGGIASSSATGTVSTTAAESASFYAGGAVGHYNLSVAPSAVSAAGHVSGGNSTGGVIGYLQSNVALAEGSLVSVVPADTVKTVSGPRWVGGLVGYSGSTGAANNLVFAGSVSASGSVGAAGGLFGRSGGAVANSSSSGSVSGGGVAGGLVGQAAGAGGFTDVSSSANVSGGSDVGGLVGEYANSGELLRGSASGRVGGGNRTGGVVGYFDSTAAITTPRYTGSSVSAGTFTSGTVFLGGLLGDSRSAAISDAVATLSLSNDSTTTLYIGGMAGRTQGAVTTASASGDVSATGATGLVHAGGLIGQAVGSGALSDLSASGDVSVASASVTPGTAGGLIGAATSGNLSGATASGNVSGQLYVGGLVGRYAPGTGTLSASSATGNVSGMGDVGGLVGFASGSGSITGSSAAGSVSSSATSTYSAGGAVGYTAMNGGVTSVSAAGVVTGGSQAGGVVGYVENSAATLSGLTATGGSVSGSFWVGGLVGYSTSTVATSGLSYSGTVTASAGGGAAGGLFGRSNAAIASSSSAGSVSGPDDVGGLVGRANGSGGFTDVTSTASVSSTTTAGNVGGLVGWYNHGGTLLRGTATGAVGGGGSTGGLVGFAQTSTSGAGISAGSATGNVTSSGGTYVGGLVGRYLMPGALANSTAAGTVVGGNNSTGGLVGYFNSAAAITASSHTGASVSEGIYVGGLVGYSESASISGASAVAAVSSTRSGTVQAGGLVGQISGTGTVSDSTASGDVAITSTTGSSSVGGLIGYVSGGTGAHISGSGASGDVSGGLYTGGLVGRFSPSSGNISGASASGAVSSRGDAGGLVGFASGTGSIATSTATGNVASSDTSGYSVGGAVGYTSQSGGVTDVAASGSVSGGAFTGGIVGYLQNASAAFSGNSTTLTSVSGHNWVGGLVGYSNAVLTGQVAAVDVTHTGTSGGAGGLVGYSSAAIGESSASGSVTSTGGSSSGAAVGGLVGFHVGGGLTNLSASGAVSGGYYVGGLVGYHSADADIAGLDATGAVSSSRNGALVGGLAGYAGGSGGMSDATATGPVTLAGSSGDVGGLVGRFSKAGGLNGATASGAVSGGDRTGGLTGYHYYGGNLQNATATGAVGGGGSVGGLVGEMYVGGNSLNLRADGAVTATGAAGGLFGTWNYSGTLTDSIATGPVVGVSHAGGLIGTAYDNNGIVNSRASGTVRGSGSVGGLVGQAGYTRIAFGVASGGVTAVSSGGSYTYTGGLVGYYYDYDGSGGIFDSSASGIVEADAPIGYTGGLVGFHGAGSLLRSGASGRVSSLDSGSSTSGGHRVGGLVGYLSANGSDSFAENSASGDVTGAGTSGGLVGEFNGNGNNVPTDVQASGQVTGRGNVGGLIGTLSYVGVVNGSASGNVTNLGNSGSTGGLVGYVQGYYDNGRVVDSRASGNVSGGTHAGGLIGTYSASYTGSTTALVGIVASEASGQVSGAQVAGGLVARYEDYYHAYRATDALSISESTATGSVTATRVAGGLVGQYLGGSGVQGNRATGDVTVERSEAFATTSAGGLIGEFSALASDGRLGRIQQSTASGRVSQTAVGEATFSGNQYFGGLVGRVTADAAASEVVLDSYATGDVAVASNGGTVHAGGLVGSTSASLARTYATGAVSTSGSAGTVRVGGLVGHSERSGTAATASYWATDSSGQTTSALGTASTLEAMRSSATFDGWDIAITGGSTSVWRQYEGRSLPLLRNFLSPLTLVLTDVSRVYDGTTGLGTAPITIGDVLVNNPSAITVFGDARNVGAYTITGDNLTSSQGGYDLVLDGSATLSITPRPLTLNGVVLDKVYDGTTSATLASSPALGNLVPGEDLLFVPGSGFAAAFETRTAGVGKTVILAGSYSITDGAVGRASNYQLPTGLTTTATITPKPLTVGSITAVDRVYDGTTVVAVNAAGGTLSGVIDGDAVGFDPASVTSGTIPTRHVGTRPVTVAGATLTGADAGNYTIAGLDGVTVEITPKTLTMNGLAAIHRDYNRDTYVSIDASGATLSGVVAGDVVLPSTSGLFGRTADKNVGDGKPVTLFNAALRGPDAGNYTVVPGDVTVNITPYLLTLYLAHTGSSSRVYDGTTAASVYFPTYWYGGDDITVSTTSVGFADKNVAYNTSGAVTSKPITASGIAISGADAGNYALQNTTATINGTITPKPLTVSGVEAVNRVYDGTRDVVVNIGSAVVDTSGLIAGDVVEVSTPAGGTVVGQVANRNVGTNKPVTVPGLALTGADAGNYAITGSGSGVTVDITRKDLTATYTGGTKVYDGTAYAPVTATADGVIAGDDVQHYINVYCSYIYYGCAYFSTPGGTPGSYTQDRNAGTDKPIVVVYNDLIGGDAGNYRLVNGTGTATAGTVTPKPVTLVFNGDTKVYDGTADATVTLSIGGSGLYSVDGITSTQTATFSGDGAKNVGSGKPIAVSGIVAGGAGLANYEILNTTATASGRITPKPVVVSGINATDRAYDGSVDVAVTVTDAIGSTGFVGGDDVSITLPAEGLTSGTIATPGVGTARPVTVTGLGLGGADAPNYSIDLASSGITVNITPKLLTPSFVGVDKIYDGGINASVSSTTTGILAGDVLTFSQVALFTGPGGKNVGSDKPIAISSITLGGASAANYGLASTSASATGNVLPKTVSPVYTGGSRVYSGVDVLDAPVSGSAPGFIGTDAVSLAQTARFTGDGSAGTGKAVSVSDILITGADAANYVLAATTASTTATVTPRPLGVTGVTATSRVYDGTNVVAVNVSGATVDTSNVIPGDSVSIELPPDGITTGTMTDRFVGTGKAVTISGASLGGSSSANYALTGASGLTVNITPRTLTAGYAALDKVYDGTANATVVATPADLLPVDAGAVGVLASGVFSAGRNVGDGKTVAVSGGYLTGAFAFNYTLANASGSTTADITPRLLGVGYGGITKVYDGGTAVDVTASLSGRITGDVVGATQSAAFTGDGAKNVGTGKPVQVSGITLTGADAGNYRIASDTLTTSGSITPRPITISGLSSVVAIDRVYDGTTTVGVLVPDGVTLTPGSSDIVPGDSVSIAVPGSGLTTGTMANKNAGTGKAVAISGLALSGADAGNYAVAGTAGVTVDIAPLGITASWSGVNRVYDGSVAAQASGTSDGVIAGDSLLIRAGGSFTDGKNVGTAKPIAVTGGVLSGGDAGNYVLLNPTGSASADVTPRTLTASYGVVEKVYDGGVAAPVTAVLSGLVSGDAVTATQTAVFSGSGARNVGSGKPVSISDIALAGSDAGNYLLSAATASTTGTITPRPITLVGLTGVTAVDRVYDGTTAVAVSLSSTGPVSIDPGSIVAGDDVGVTSLSGGTTTGTMADKHVGTAKPVVVDGLALTGSDAPNYRIAATEGVTVDIAPRPLTAVYSGVDKVYDGTATATVAGASADILGGDSVAIGGSAVFAAGRNAGTGLVVNVTAGALTGADAANYLLTNPSGSTTASILPKTVTASYSGGTRVYDGTVLAPVSGLVDGLIVGDAVTLSQAAEFTGAGAKNVGSGKAVSVSGIALSGADAANYQLSSDSAVTTASITPRPLRIIGLTGVTAVDRVYDGTREVQVNVATSGPITPEPGDLIDGDEVTLTAPPTGSTTGLMLDKHVGNAKPVAVSGLAIGGADAGNYSVAETTGVTVNITPRALTPTFIGTSRVYDGSTAASAGGSSADILAGDAVLIVASGVFTGDGARNAGLGKPVSITSALLTGADGGNYLLTTTTGSTTADITPRTLSASYTGVDRVYDGSTDASVLRSLAGLVDGDSVSVSESARFTDGKNVGSAKPVLVSGIALAGADAGNYVLGSATAATTASVTPRLLTVTGLSGLTVTDRVYDGTLDVAVGFGSGGGSTGASNIVPGDDVGVAFSGGGGARMLDKHAGLAKPVTLSGLTVTGADAGNYSVGGVEGLTVNIAPRPVTLAGVLAVDRVYDGSTAVAIDRSGATIGGAIAGDLLEVAASATGNMADKHAGTAKPVSVAGLALAGADAGNYVVVDSAAITVNIAPREIGAVFAGVDRVYDGTTAATVAITAAGLVSGDAVSLAGTAVFTGPGARNAGADKPVSISDVLLTGADAANYRLASSSGSTTASILPRPLSAGATVAPRVYDGTTTASVSLVGGGVVDGDAVSLSGTATYTGAGGKNVGVDKPVTVAGLTLSGADAGNYTLAGVDSLVTTGTITPRPLALSMSVLDKVYDGDTTASVSITSDRIAGDDLAVVPGVARFEQADAGSGLRVSVASLALGGADSGNYSLPGALPEALGRILRAPLLITAGTLDKVYGDALVPLGTEFSATGLVGTQTVGSVTLSSAGLGALQPVSGSPYALVASAATGGSFNPANYDIGYRDGAVIVRPRTVTVSSDFTIAFENALDGLSFSATVSGLLADRGHSVSGLVPPAPSLAGAIGGSRITLLHAGGSVSGTEPGNYVLRYEAGRLLVLPRPVLLSDQPEGGGGGFGIGSFTPEELDAAAAALQETIRMLNAPPAADGTAGPGLQPPSLPATLTAAQIAALFGNDARQITLPALQQLPLISFDPVLRRLLGAPTTP